MSPYFWFWFWTVNVIRWMILFVVGILFFMESIPFIVYVSLDTALLSALAGWASALSARKADDNDPL